MKESPSPLHARTLHQRLNSVWPLVPAMIIAIITTLFLVELASYFL